MWDSKGKTSVWIGGLLLAVMLLTGCGEHKKTADNHIKVGVVGAEQQVAEVVKQVAKQRYGLDVELVVFNDFVVPNAALSKGDIDVNAFQHGPYLQQQEQSRGYKLAVVGKTFLYPIAGYSKKITALDQLKPGDEIAVPNDPANLGRALLLLQQVGLIKLRAGSGLLPTVLDIVDNPQQLKLLELEAPQLPRTLDDPKVVIAIINTTYSTKIGLIPTKDGLFVENKSSPYVNLIVAREDNKNQAKVKTFVKAYQSAEVAAAAQKVFKGSAIVGW